ncbi:MAG TPA: insulinase family protein, partial [Rhodothermales bacterium]
FTQSELDRQKRETLRAYERAFNERNNTNSVSYADEYVSNFLEGEAIPGIEHEYDLVQKLLPTITLEQLNAKAEQLLTPENRAVFVQMPEKEGLEKPTEEALAGVFDAIAGKTIEPYVEEISDQPLIAEVPPPAAIVSEEEHADVGVREIELANGVTVVMKPTDFKDDEVRFTAFSKGGASLVSDEDYFDATLASAIVTQSGVGPFDRTTLEKMLAGKVVSVTPSITDTREGLSGMAAPADLETLFQLIHLYFTAPRADSSALAMLQNQYRAFLINRSADPEAAFEDSLQMALYGKHPRNIIPTIPLVEDLSLRTVEKVYRERFANAGDFTFVFVGNFEPDSLERLAQTYLGTLPSANGEEAWRDVYPDLAEGVVERTLYKGLGDRSQVTLVFTGDLEYNKENRHRLRSLDEVLTILLREALREDLGGTYGVGVGASPTDSPEERYTFTISFSSDPDRADELLGAVWATIDSVKAFGPPADDLEKVKEQQRRSRQTDLETNPFWVSVLDFYYSHENEPLSDVNAYLRMTEELTVEEMQQAARDFLREDSYVKVVLYPENYASGASSN